MSDYCHMKVLRIPYEPWAWGWTNLDPDADSWEYVERHFSEDVFDPYARRVNTFTFAPTNKEFVDYVLEYNSGDAAEYGRVRELYPIEVEKYFKTFRQLGTVDMDKVHLVDFYWYTATEAPDYYDIESDPFYDPV